ncbi:MAG: hypothetical protein ABWZ25_10020 [Chitinophagaceae bacterium]
MNTSLSEFIFGMPLRELSMNHLFNLFKDEQEETDVLEFKTYIDDQQPGTDKNSRESKKLDEIIVAISAFLNSDGGILIWGAPKGKTIPPRKERVYIGDLRPVSLLIEQEQFLNKVAAENSPVPLRVNYHRI